MIHRKTYWTLVCAIVLLSNNLFSQAPVQKASEPSPENSFGHLAHSGVVPSSKAMYNAVAKVEIALREVTEKLSKDPAPDSKQMAKMYLLAGQLNRWVAFLEHYREPAAVDWRLRAGYYMKALLEIRNRYYGTPAAPKARVQVLKILDNGQKARAKAYANVFKTLQTGEAKQAENQIEKIQNEILSISGVLQDPDKKPYYTPMNEAEGAVASEMAKVRAREAAEAEQAEVNKLEELTSALMETLNRGSGIEGLSKAAAQWKVTHLQRLRVHAFTHAGRSGYSTGSEGVAMSAPRVASENQDDRMSKVKAAFAEFVMREAASASPSNGLDHYLAIQQVLAELSLRADDADWNTALEKSLEALAKKCQIGSDLYNYRQATDELLRWRQRTAAEWAESMPGTRIVEVAQKELGYNEKYVGLYQQNQQIPLPLLLKPIPDVVPDVQQKLVGKPVRTSRVIPLTGDSASGWITQADEGFYCNFPKNSIKESVAVVLRKELQCEGNNRPLSLQAATAIMSADAGLCDEAGGTLGEFVIESYISRLCNVPEPQFNIVPLGSLGTELIGDCRRCLLFRWELQQVDWIKHKYMLVSNKSN